MLKKINKRYLAILIIFGILLISTLVYFLNPPYGVRRPEVSDLKPYQSNLSNVKKYLQSEIKNLDARKQLLRYAIALDNILKSPELNDEEFQMSLQGESEKVKAMNCVISLKDFDSHEPLETIREILIHSRQNWLRYHIYERQFYGKLLSSNKSIVNYEKDCTD